MNYDDFPILDDHLYQTINQGYSAHIDFDRRRCVRSIFDSLVSIKNICLSAYNSCNPKTTASISKLKKIIEKNLENLVSIFNLAPKNQNIIKNFNIFALLKELTTTLSYLVFWSQNEEKVYYQNISYNITNELLTELKSTLQTLQDSNIIIFKHM